MRIARVSSFVSTPASPAASRPFASSRAFGSAVRLSPAKHPRLPKRVTSRELLVTAHADARAASCFSCPVCAGKMSRVVPRDGVGPVALRCAANHSFDVAREGHVNLLARRGSPKVTGDSSAMLHARRRFLNAGHYREVSDLVCRSVLAAVKDANAAADVLERRSASGASSESDSESDADAEPEPEPEPATATATATVPATVPSKLSPRKRRLAANKRKSKAAKSLTRPSTPTAAAETRPPPPLVVDFGCGEGWWLEQVVRGVAADSGCDAARYAAFDASPAAARMTSKLLSKVDDDMSASASSDSESEHQHPTEVAVADAQGGVPFCDGSVSAAMSVFAPRNPEELRRVVAPGGVAVVVSPGTNHLRQLRDERAREIGVTVLDVAEGKQERTAASMRAVGFALESETAVEGVMALRSGDVADLVGMGPSAFHQSEGSEEALRELFGESGDDALSVTKSFVVQVFRREEEAETAANTRDAGARRADDADDADDAVAAVAFSPEDVHMEDANAMDDSEDIVDASVAVPAAYEYHLPGLFEPAGCALVGHRGDGMNRRSGAGVRENTVASFVAADANGATWCEFDVQCTRDGVPVLWHDEKVLVRRGRGPLRATSVRSLTSEEFRALSRDAMATAAAAAAGDPAAVEAVEGAVPLSDDAVEDPNAREVVFYRKFPVGYGARSAPDPEPWVMSREAPVPTLEEIFRDAPRRLGFCMELKFDEGDDRGAEAKEAELRAVLALCAAHPDRRVLFSSFDPDVALGMRRLQTRYPVMMITNCRPGHADPRRNSLDAAIRVATEGGLCGLMVNVLALGDRPEAAEEVRAHGLLLGTYGKENDNLALAAEQVRRGVCLVCTDSVAELERDGHFRARPNVGHASLSPAERFEAVLSSRWYVGARGGRSRAAPAGGQRKTVTA